MSARLDNYLKSRLEELNELGLTLVQARVYVLLMSLGPSTARTISRVSGLAREDTYRALRVLKTLGLVEVIFDRVYTFVAVEPDVAVKILLAQLERKIDIYRRRVHDFGTWLRGLDRVKTVNETPSDKWVFKLEGGSQIFEHMSRLIMNCQSELVRVTSGTGICQNYVLGIFDQEQAIVQRGVKVRAITEITVNNRAIAEEYAQIVDLRHLSSLPSSLKFVIADDAQMILFTTNPSQNVGDLGAIWTNNKPLIEGFKTEFEQCWAASVPALEMFSSTESQAKGVSGLLPHQPPLYEPDSA